MTAGLQVIIRRVSEGDPNAFRELFDLYSHKVNGFALKMTHSESTAEEIVQEIFMKIWVNRRSLIAVEFFPAYLMTITRNHTLNVLKRLVVEEKAKKSFAKDLSGVHTETEETVIYRDYNNLLNRAIEGLPPQQRLVYSMCRGEGLKYEEVADRLCISRFTVKTHMQQALRSIQLQFRMITKIFLPVLLALPGWA